MAGESPAIPVKSLSDQNLLDVNSTMHCDAACFHDDVVIKNVAARLPGCYFLRRPPKRDGEFFVPRLEGAITKFSHHPRSFLLPCAPVNNNVIRKLQRTLRAPAERLGKQICQS